MLTDKFLTCPRSLGLRCLSGFRDLCAQLQVPPYLFPKMECLKLLLDGKVGVDDERYSWDISSPDAGRVLG